MIQRLVEERRLSFLGDAYADGIMRGGAMEEQKEVEVFELFA